MRVLNEKLIEGLTILKFLRIEIVTITIKVEII